MGGGVAKLTVFYLNDTAMDPVQVGKAVLVKKSNTALGVEPRTFLDALASLGSMLDSDSLTALYL